MPAFVTHELFGERIFKELPVEIKELLNRNPAPFFWGLQGPDILFFKDAIRGESALPGYGGRMHSENTDSLFEAMGNVLLAMAEGDEKETLLSYTIGFIGHYSLDTAAHPYIYWMQAQAEKQLEANLHRGIHNRLESDIDTALYRLWKNRPVSAYRPAKRLWGRKKDYAKIAALYTVVLRQVYGIEANVMEIATCFPEATFLLKATIDPLGGGVLKATKLWEKARNRPNTLSAHVRRQEAEGDVLNLAHNSWRPLDKDEAWESRSFIEIFDEAVPTAVDMIKTWCACIRNNKPFCPQGLPPFDNGSV